MTFTSSATQTNTWTILQARYVTSKIAADLEIVRAQYLRPTSGDITAYAEEAAQLLNERYFGWAEYGFRRGDETILALKYTANNSGSLSGNDRPGGIPARLNLDGSEFYSFLDYSAKFYALDDARRSAFLKALPVQRTHGGLPKAGAGYWETVKTYSANGEGVTRQVFRPL